MPIKKRRSRRSEFVYLDKNILVVKTPAECTKWPNAFRLRIVKDYTPPRQLRMSTEFHKNFVDNGNQANVYNVAGKQVKVVQPFQPIASAQIVVIRTDVINVQTGMRLFLHHNDPAMRMLMVYAFLNDLEIGGVPKLDIAPCDDEC